MREQPRRSVIEAREDQVLAGAMAQVEWTAAAVKEPIMHKLRGAHSHPKK